MRRVYVESRFAGDVERNLRYLRACIKDCLGRDEAPFASHGLYPQVLDDSNVNDRILGIRAGSSWRPYADATVVYEDLGYSLGMRQGIDEAKSLTRFGHKLEYRNLGGEWSEP